jgi:hypothetical protein
MVSAWVSNLRLLDELLLFPVLHDHAEGWIGMSRLFGIPRAKFAFGFKVHLPVPFRLTLPSHEPTVFFPLELITLLLDFF